MWALTYDCNMQCEYCYLKNRLPKHEDISFAECRAIVRGICMNDPWRPDAVWLTGGEPTLKLFLPDLIDDFQSNNIPVVVNTNGMCDNDRLDDILNSRPRGITVSLDSHIDNELSHRGNTKKIFQKIQYISSHKHPSTILGTAVVLTDETIATLYDYAKAVKELGVEYISLNPYYSPDNKNVSGQGFSHAINRIKSENIIKLPNDDYLKMLDDFYSHLELVELTCPAYNSYFFISPWGEIFPCSNEIWQDDSMHVGFDALATTDLYQNMKKFKEKIQFQSKSTKSSCFGTRCLGCWKLYFDTIFT